MVLRVLSDFWGKVAALGAAESFGSIGHYRVLRNVLLCIVKEARSFIFQDVT